MIFYVKKLFIELFEKNSWRILRPKADEISRALGR
jgi:hypothetical protein